MLGLSSAKITPIRLSTQKKFRLDLAENLVLPLLDLIPSPSCPAYLRTTKGRKPVSTAKRLIGKHFAYKSKKRGRCLVCGDRKTSAGKRRDTKTQNFCPKNFCVWGNALKTNIPAQTTDSLVVF